MITPPPVSFMLAYTPPLDWPFFLRYFGTRSTPGVECVGDQLYARTIAVGAAAGVLEIRHQLSEHRLAVSVHGAASGHADEVAARVAGMFDLGADMPAVHRVLLADARLAPHVRAAPGVRVPGAWCPFELIARAIVGQQISVRAATTIMGRIAERLGSPIGPPEGSEERPLRFVFPSPRAVADGDLERIGMPGKRVQALRNVARAFADGAILLPENGGDREQVKGALLSLAGIGPWTVEYFSLRALRDPDAWPGTDLVLRRAVMPDPAARPSPTALLRLAEPWRPWRAYAAVHLWNGAAREHGAGKQGPRGAAPAPRVLRRRPSDRRYRA